MTFTLCGYSFNVAECCDDPFPYVSTLCDKRKWLVYPFSLCEQC